MERRRPGIVKAAPLRADLDEEEARGGAFVRAVLNALDALIAQESPGGAAAFVWGTAERGGARLIRPSAPDQPNSLRISWIRDEIVGIEIEPRDDVRFQGPESPIDPAVLMPRLIPMAWAYIRRGGELPSGVHRFAGFF